MNKLWLLFLLVIPYQSIHAQKVKHAPTVEQCSPAVQHPKEEWKTIFLRYSATDLRDMCRDYINTSEQKHTIDDAAIRGAVCLGYVLGAVDGMAMVPDDSFASDACVPPPEKAMGDELIRVTLKYIDEHPKDLPAQAGIIVWRAMVDAYPCPAK